MNNFFCFILNANVSLLSPLLVIMIVTVKYRQISSNGLYREEITNNTAHFHELFCVSAIQTRSWLPILYGISICKYSSPLSTKNFIISTTFCIIWVIKFNSVKTRLLQITRLVYCKSRDSSTARPERSPDPHLCRICNTVVGATTN